MLSVEKCNFSPRNFIFYTTNFILSYRNLNYNKEKSDFSVRFDCHFCVKLSFIPVFLP